MRFIKCLALTWLLISAAAHSAQPSWQVKPSVCVAEKLGSACQMQIKVLAKNLSQGQYCLYLQQQRLRCLANNRFPISLTIEISAPSELMLKNELGDVLLSQKLSVKTLTSDSQRRRLRTPWSLF